MKVPFDLWSLRRTGILPIATSVLLGLCVAGCSRDEAEKIVIRGSNTIGEELAPRLIAEYRKEHPATVFDLEFKGTSYGLGALMVDRCDIAAASRDVTTNEMDLARDRNIALNNYVLGTYCVAVMVNTANPVANLTRDQVRDIFTGGVQNWKEVGGPDAPIHLHIRDPISGTYLGFQELAMEKKPYAHALKTFTNYTEIVQAIARDPNAIGYAGIDLPRNPTVKAVSIDGMAPTPETVNSGKYPYARVLRFYTIKSKEPPDAMDFIRFVQSARGQQIVKEMGYVPRP